MPGRPRPPLEIWLYSLGILLYGFVPMLPWERWIPVNPASLFAALMGGFLIVERTRRRYWIAIGFGLLTALYPLTVLSRWIQIADPPLARIYLVTLTPVILLCLLAAKRVRRFAGVGQEDPGHA